MRDYRYLDELDVKLQLLSGGSIQMEGLELPQHTLREIIDYGYSDYMHNIQFLSITIEDFIASVTDIEKRMMLEVEKSNLNSYDFYMNLGGNELREEFLHTIAMVFKTDDVKIIEGNIIAINFMNKGILNEDDKGDLIVNHELLEEIDETELEIIHRDNFDAFVEALKLINYLSKPSKKDDKDRNPADEETKALMEHMEKMRKKVEEKKKKQGKQDDNAEIDIFDIISAISSKSNSINKINIWDLTIYQLYDEYSRLELIDNYEFSVKAMMAGASKVDLKHWSSKI